MSKPTPPFLINQIIIDSAPFAVNLWDENRNIIATSQHAVEMHGMRDKKHYMEEFYALSPKYQPCGSLSADLVTMWLDRTYREGYAKFEWMHCNYMGDLIPAEITLVRFMQGDKPMIVSYTTDMRTLKEAARREREVELKIHEQDVSERIRIMFDATPLIIQFWDKDFICIECNQTTLDFYGFKSKKEYHAKLKRALPPVQSDGVESWTKWNHFLAKVFEHGTGKTDFEETDLSGNMANFETTGMRTFLNGETVVITYSTNVTILNKMTTHLIESANNAVAANDAKVRFLNRISQEIQNPMQTIAGMVSIGRAADNTNRKDYALDKIEVAASHLMQIVSNILEMAKIESNKRALDFMVFDYNSMLQNAIERVKVTAAEKKHFIDIIRDPNLPEILNGDKNLLTQVVANLLSNAVIFTPERGIIKLHISCIEIYDDGNVLIQIDVTDNGIGMTSLKKERLRACLSQNTDTALTTGDLGLGLTVSKQIVELMNGSIWFESTQGKGTVFSFSVPIGFVCGVA